MLMITNMYITLTYKIEIERSFTYNDIDDYQCIGDINHDDIF